MAEPPDDADAKPNALSRAAASPEVVDTVPFRSGQTLDIVRTAEREELLLRAEGGECIMRIEMTAQGPVFVVQGEAIAIAARSVLSLKAQHIQLEAGSVDVKVDGGLRIDANEIAARASHGGIDLQANDDVNINGERVRLNSEDPPMPLSWDEFEQRKLKRQQQALLEVAAEGAAVMVKDDRAGQDGAGQDGAGQDPAGDST